MEDINAPEDIPTPKYKEGEQYDFPLPTRPEFNEQATNPETGETFDTHPFTAATANELSRLGNKIVLVQIPNYWVEAMKASDLVAEFEKRGKNSAGFMVLIPTQE